MSKDKAMKAVNAIIEDLSDRRGLRQEWESIDNDIQQEIREEWAGLIEVSYVQQSNNKKG